MEVKDNQDPACQGLRAAVQDEFTRHHLIESQHPVASSDHTRGLAFDATVMLPPAARLGRRKVTLDSLARYAGLRRPDILHDPVHFKFTGGAALMERRHYVLSAAHHRVYGSRYSPEGRRYCRSSRYLVSARCPEVSP